MSDDRTPLEQALEGQPGNRTLAEVFGVDMPARRPSSPRRNSGHELTPDELVVKEENWQLVNLLRNLKHHTTRDVLLAVLESRGDGDEWSEHIRRMIRDFDHGN